MKSIFLKRYKKMLLFFIILLFLSGCGNNFRQIVLPYCFDGLRSLSNGLIEWLADNTVPVQHQEIVPSTQTATNN